MERKCSASAVGRSGDEASTWKRPGSEGVRAGSTSSIPAVVSSLWMYLDTVMVTE